MGPKICWCFDFIDFDVVLKFTVTVDVTLEVQRGHKPFQYICTKNIYIYIFFGGVGGVLIRLIGENKGYEFFS
jgi:hypothetical protein